MTMRDILQLNFGTPWYFDSVTVFPTDILRERKLAASERRGERNAGPLTPYCLFISKLKVFFSAFFSFVEFECFFSRKVR